MATPIISSTHTIDASGRTVGRVASEAAKALMGKMSASYTPHIRSDVKVTIINASKIYSRERKSKSTFLRTYSGFPSGQKVVSIAEIAEKKGHREVIRRAVARMLPRNTMHTPRLKNLTISE
jgi:large subunit ribosomal protein L13